MGKVSPIYQDGRHLQGGQILHHLYGSGFVTADISDFAWLGNFLWDDGVWSGNVLYSGGKFLPVSQEPLGSFPWLTLELTLLAGGRGPYLALAHSYLPPSTRDFLSLPACL